MKKETGYPSIDKTHEKDEKFLDKHPIIPSVSIYNALKLISGLYKKDNAIDCLDLTITFEELINNSATLSKGFKELGIKKDDIIAVSMPNFYQAVAVFLAANRIGAVTTFLNSNAEKAEIKKYLNEFESPLFVNFDKSLEYNFDIKKDTKVKQIITLHNKDLNIKDFYKEDNGLIGYNDFLSFNEMGSVADYYKKPIYTFYGGNQNSQILFTSGTTGNPKSVVLTNKNILASGLYMKNSTHLKNTRGEKSLVCVPFSYPYGFDTSALMSLLCGREAILAPNLSKDNVSYFLAKSPNILFGSPAFLELIKRNIPDDQDLSSVDTFISGGDFLMPEQSNSGKEFFAQHGADVAMCNGSGNAETTATSTMAFGFANKPETVGRVLFGSRSIILNLETEEEVKYGEEGSLCIAGKHVFKEYYKNPELTKEAKICYKGKEYVRTGMRGFLSEDGYFTLTGRDSRYYIMSTLDKVYCDKVQKSISTIDCIDSCAVVKKPDDDLLYVNKAYIVLKDGLLNNEDTIEHINQECLKLKYKNDDDLLQLREYEIPDSFEILDELPKTEADKVDYNKLEELAKKEVNNEYKVRKLDFYRG